MSNKYTHSAINKKEETKNQKEPDSLYNLDVIKGPGSQPVRDWEGSKELADIYKLISKNKKIIEKKAKLYNMKTTSNMFI